MPLDERREATWAEACKQFVWLPGETPEQSINRIVNDWVPTFFPHRVALNETNVVVWSERWSSEELWAVLFEMASHWDHRLEPERRYVTHLAPRFTDYPVTMFRAHGKIAMLDGRRRINLWARNPGHYPVLVIGPRA